MAVSQLISRPRLLSLKIGPRHQGGWAAGWSARIRDWLSRSWSTVRPGPEGGQGAFFALLLTIAWAATVGAMNLKSGFGYLPDFVFVLTVAAIGVPLATMVVALLLTLLRLPPRLVSGFVVASICFIALLWTGSAVGYASGALLVAVEAGLGASLAVLLHDRWRGGFAGRRIVAVVVCLLTLAINAWLFWFLHDDGPDQRLLDVVNSHSLPAPLNAENPTQRGQFAVRTLFYGPGTDIRRPEFGETVAIKTGNVNAAPFFKEFDGWKAALRRRYWGFGMDRLPLNGRVWYPEGRGPFPLVLMVHGNHNMAEFSDPGYAYLGELLASRGFVFVSIDENFLNVGLFHDPPKQQAVRAWLLLEHLKLWHKWNESPGNPFFQRVDLAKVALMGHSRGGEAAATAVLFNRLKYYPEDANIKFDYGFPIQAVVAIAPPDGQYKPAGQWRILQDIDYFTIQGANDADLASFAGSRQWDHVRFTGEGSFYKAELYINRANHGQFNTIWGRTDAAAPGSWLLDLRPLLKGEEQRQIAKVYLSAFLEASLHGRREYLPLFADHRRILKWLPRTLYVSRYSDSSYRTLADFNEDADLTSTTAAGGHIRGAGFAVWREGRIPFRHGDRDSNGVFLGWHSKCTKQSAGVGTPSYEIELPAGFAASQQLDVHSTLSLSVAVTDQDPREDEESETEGEKESSSKKTPQLTDFSVEMTAGNGQSVSLPISRFVTLLPPLAVRFTKLAYLEKTRYHEESEPVFQSVQLPLADFAGVNPGFDPAHLKSIRLQFDRTPEGVIIISQIGFIRSGTSATPHLPLQSAKIKQTALR